MFLFRRNFYKNEFFFKKQKTQTIALRSPKHFNIGKYKIFNINFKTLNLTNNIHLPTHLNTLLSPTTLIYDSLSKNLPLSPVLRVKSLKLSINTKFKLKWLET